MHIPARFLAPLALCLSAALTACATNTPERQAMLNACAAGDLDYCRVAEEQRIEELDAVMGDNVWVW